MEVDEDLFYAGAAGVSGEDDKGGFDAGRAVYCFEEFACAKDVFLCLSCKGDAVFFNDFAEGLFKVGGDLSCVVPGCAVGDSCGFKEGDFFAGLGQKKVRGGYACNSCADDGNVSVVGCGKLDCGAVVVELVEPGGKCAPLHGFLVRQRSYIVCGLE